jgi:predicted DNA binding protein
MFSRMYQLKIYIDFHNSGMLGEVTGSYNEPFEVLEESISDDGIVMFVLDARDQQKHLYEQMVCFPEVLDVECVDDRKLLVKKEAKGSLTVIRNNHGMLCTIDKVWGTKRIFNILFLRKQDAKNTVSDLKPLGDVQVEKLTAIFDKSKILTEKQHEVIQTALTMGYFDWPRTAKVEDVAEELDVTHPTVVEHLRKAEKKLLTQALELPARK